MRNRRFTVEQYAGALRQAGGNRAAAAAMLGCPVSNLHSVVRSHVELKALCAPRPRSTGSRPRYRPDEVADALRQAGGNQAEAARRLGCRKQTVATYVKRCPEVKAALAACPPRLKSPKQIVAALRQAGGCRVQAARALGMSRNTLLKYIRRYPAAEEVCAALDQARRKGQPEPAGRIYAQRYTPEEMIEALRLGAGIKAETARRLGCTRATVNAYIKRYPEVHEAWIDARETMVDLAQSKLQDAVERGEWKAVQYTLSTLGKDRGFTTRPVPLPWEISEQERRRAQLEADIKRVYGELDEEDEPDEET